MSEDPETTKLAAQQRADRIRAFRTEQEQAERDRALVLSDEQRSRLRSYHDEILAGLAQRFDVDVSQSQKQVSWGMRIASTIGALALGASIYLFFYRFWGLMSTRVQIVVLVLGPLLAVGVAESFGRRERTLYFTSLAGMLAVTCFVLNISVLGSIFNITPSENALLLWGAFALILAYNYGLRLILAAGILCLMGYLTAKTGTWSGIYWIFLGQRPENYMLAGLAAFCVPLVVRHRLHDDFPPIYRILGLQAVFLPVLVLGNWGDASYLRLTSSAVEILYQLVGFVLAGLAIWIGVRNNWKGVTYTGTTYLVVFLYTKFFDWWWELMPKYLFFLVLGLIAIGLLLILRRFRSMIREATS